MALAVADGRYAFIFQTLAEGLWTTVYVAVISFALAATSGCCWHWLADRSGCGCARARVSTSRCMACQPWSSCFTSAFVGAPALVNLYQWACEVDCQRRLPDVQC